MFNQPEFRALMISLLAGLSTMIGSFAIFKNYKNKERALSIALGFAAGVMISVSLSELFVQSMSLMSESQGEKLGVIFAVAFLIVGMFIAAGIDKFVPHDVYDDNNEVRPHKNLFKVGFVSMLAIGLHNFPEGIATFMAGYNDLSMGLTIAVAITCHNIPEGISVAMPIYHATGSRKKAVYYTFLSGVAEPIGALIAFLVLKPFLSDLLLGILFSLVSGIMIYIALEELIPSSRQYGYKKPALYAALAGICLIPLTNLF